MAQEAAHTNGVTANPFITIRVYSHIVGEDPDEKCIEYLEEGKVTFDSKLFSGTVSGLDDPEEHFDDFKDSREIAADVLRDVQALITEGKVEAEEDLSFPEYDEPLPKDERIDEATVKREFRLTQSELERVRESDDLVLGEVPEVSDHLGYAVLKAVEQAQEHGGYVTTEDIGWVARKGYAMSTKSGKLHEAGYIKRIDEGVLPHQYYSLTPLGKDALKRFESKHTTPNAVV